jgi:hypothetical protein
MIGGYEALKAGLETGGRGLLDDRAIAQLMFWRPGAVHSVPTLIVGVLSQAIANEPGLEWARSVALRSLRSS